MNMFQDLLNPAPFQFIIIFSTYNLSYRDKNLNIQIDLVDVQGSKVALEHQSRRGILQLKKPSALYFDLLKKLLLS